MHRLGFTVMLLAAAASCTPRAARQPASLCIERPEQHGRINIVPVSLLIASQEEEEEARAELVFSSGGQSTCVELAAGPASVAMRFPYPYGGPGEPERYWTSDVALDLRPGRNRATLDTSSDFAPERPGWRETGWHRMWELRLAR